MPPLTGLDFLWERVLYRDVAPTALGVPKSSFPGQSDRRYLFKTGEERLPEDAALDGAGFSLGTGFLQRCRADGAGLHLKAKRAHSDTGPGEWGVLTG
jgi:hypothetical protein